MHPPIRSAVFVTLMLLALALLGLSGADPALAQAPAEQNTAKAPAGYAPAPLPAAPRALVEDADILLIQTSLPWNSDANTQVLDALKFSYDIVDMGSISTVDVFSYQVVLIVNDQVQAFYDQYAAQASLFQEYVTSGGTLVFFAAGAGWAGGQLTAPLPGGVTWVYGYDPTNSIRDANHPIVTGVLSGGNAEWGGPLQDADLYGNYCSHGYFSNAPADARVILASSTWNEPTLMEYALGSGKVIASTLTWEAYWAWHPGSGGAFAKKALDDVFQYAFAGGGEVIDDVAVQLHTEDAPDGLRIRKSGGSYVDIIAKVTGTAAHKLTVTLQSPAALFAEPVKTFTRNRTNNGGYGQENQYKRIEAGTSQIETTLVQIGLLPSSHTKEVVWRFRVPENAAAQNNVQFAVTVSAPGVIIPNNSDQAAIDIISRADGFAVTDRQRLFDEEGAIADVSSLLEEVYRAVDQVQGEVFYVDRYDVKWEYKTDVDALNKGAAAVDAKIEAWYQQLVDGGRKPQYLLLVGGDNIIPFARMNDGDYNDCWIPGNRPRCEEDSYGSYADASQPIGYSYNKNRFLSDNIYGDIGGDKGDWEKGTLELAVGRIVGADAAAMKAFIENGTKTTRIAEAGYAVIPGIDHSGYGGLAGRGVNRHGFENPDLVDNDSWNRADFLTVWNTNSSFYYLALHANPTAMSPVTGSDADKLIRPENLAEGRIAHNHPLVSTLACNLAVPVDGSVVFKKIGLGIGGFVGSTALGRYSNDGTTGGEKLVNLFGENLLSSAGDQTRRFGDALMWAKQEFEPTGWYWSYTGVDKKAILEYVFYGVPWGRAELNAPAAQAQSAFTNTGHQPQTEAAGAYTQIVQSRVESYTLSTVQGYDLLAVPGSNILQDAGAPSLPFVVQTVHLPPGATVQGLTLVSEDVIDLGVRNVPHVGPVTTYDPEPVLQPVSGVSGVYPTPRYSYEVAPYDSYTAVRIMVALAQYNADTGNLKLFENTELRLAYSTATAAVLDGFELAQDRFAAAANVTGSAQLRNVTGDARTFSAELVIHDTLDTVLATQTYPPFSVPAGAPHTLAIDWPQALPKGAYQAVLNLREGGAVIATQRAAFQIMAGEVTHFHAPASLPLNGLGEFSLGFANHTAAPAEVTAEVFIYDQQDLLVSKLLRQRSDIAAHSTGEFDWTWLPSSLPAGEYLAQAKVIFGGENYSSSGRLLMLGDVHRATAALISPQFQTGQPGAQVTYQIQLENTGNVTDTYTAGLSGNAWPAAVLPAADITLPGGGMTTLDMVVSIPATGIHSGDRDAATLTIVAQATGAPVFTQTLATAATTVPAAVVVSAQPAAITADGSSTGKITATVKDVFNDAVPNQAVVFTTSRGSITAAGVTDAAGQATAVLTSSVTAGQAVVTAAVGGVSGQVQVPFVAGPPAALALSISPAALYADGASTAIASVVVKDAHGNRVPGQTVTFAATLGTITPSAVTDAAGKAAATLTSVKQVGQAQVTAAAGGLSAVKQVAFSGRVFTGAVFVDLNENGVRESDETGIADVGVEMALVALAAADPTAAAAGPVWRTTTDALGSYTIPDLPLGEYRATLQLPPGYTATTPTRFTVTIGPVEGQVVAPAVGALAHVYLPAVRQ